MLAYFMFIGVSHEIFKVDFFGAKIFSGFIFAFVIFLPVNVVNTLPYVICLKK
jgi:hypothetical protein